MVLPTPIPNKGRVLTALSNFWFARTKGVMTNHLLDIKVEEVITDKAEREMLRGRAVVVRKSKPLAIEAIVRGYLVGSGWKDYQATGEVCGVKLPKNLPLAAELPEPIFTPSTKADIGAHDENIDFAAAAKIVGAKIANRCATPRSASIRKHRTFAASRGIIIADTKMEFGLDEKGNIILIDELLTPDSSRFSAASRISPRGKPAELRQAICARLARGVGLEQKPPAPALPDDVVANTAAKYKQAYDWLVEGAGAQKSPVREPV